MGVSKQSLRILLIDDELLQRKIVSQQLAQLGFISESAATAAEGLALLQKKEFDVVLLDVQMSDVTGLEALPRIKRLDDPPEVIMLTLDKSLESGITAMRQGAYDYLTKPAMTAELEVVVKKAAEKRRLIRQNTTLRDFVESKTSGTQQNQEISHLSPAMQQIVDQAITVAGHNSTVLLTGESGTGKDVLARFIHNRSRRSAEGMISVNCGAMPETLFESEFFGHERGAFSGASHTKHGLIEVADGSTLFLDEIGEMPPNLQVKLLRFLENGEFRRVGGTRDLKSDVRLIAATNQDLTVAITENRFRSDLYYRLNVIHFHLPPLRRRKEDLHALIDSFLETYREQFQKPGLTISPNARRKLEAYRFPGNIRELKNIIERAVALSSGSTIESEQIILPTADIHATAAPNLEFGHASQPIVAMESVFTSDNKIVRLEDLERKYILSVLGYTGGNRERAAELLGISERTLYRRISAYVDPS